MLPQKILQGKGHEMTIPGNIFCNISSSKGKTVILPQSIVAEMEILILLTHSEDQRRMFEAVICPCQRMVESHMKQFLNCCRKQPESDCNFFHLLDCKLHMRFSHPCFGRGNSWGQRWENKQMKGASTSITSVNSTWVNSTGLKQQQRKVISAPTWMSSQLHMVSPQRELECFRLVHHTMSWQKHSMYIQVLPTLYSLTQQSVACDLLMQSALKQVHKVFFVFF